MSSYYIPKSHIHLILSFPCTVTFSSDTTCHAPGPGKPELGPAPGHVKSKTFHPCIYAHKDLNLILVIISTTSFISGNPVSEYLKIQIQTSIYIVLSILHRSTRLHPRYLLSSPSYPRNFL